jgi:hypothetical protein
MVVWGSFVLTAMMSWMSLGPQFLPEVNLVGMTVIRDSRFPMVSLDREHVPSPCWMLEERMLARGGPME